MLNALKISWTSIATALLWGLALPLLGTAPVSAQVTTETTTQVAGDGPVDISRDVYISSNDWEANLKKNIAVYIGDVVVKQKDLTLYSDRMTVFFQGSEAADKTITRLDVSGGVRLTTKNETIESTWGIYDVEEKIVTLGGNVLLKAEEGETRSERLTYDLDSGVITMQGKPTKDGRVTGKFTLPEKKKDPSGGTEKQNDRP
ncbi:LptA/OstA family protein [Paremcibacter congregatus]|uniref:LptA/OstA family protein n=1 Tax=Paremcibacter congregatus TaxID=2043170 RepID=UPI0030EF8AF0